MPGPQYLEFKIAELMHKGCTLDEAIEVCKAMRRAKERVREQKATERIAKFYIFCVAVPAWILSAFGCWVIWRLFL